MSLDLVGPYPVGRDDGRRQKGKYIMVATVPLPMLERADIQVEEKADVVLDEKETSEGPEESPGDQQEASSEPQVSGKEAILEELEDDPDAELVSDEAVKPLKPGMAGTCGGPQGSGWTPERHLGGDPGVEAHWAHRRSCEQGVRAL